MSTTDGAKFDCPTIHTIIVVIDFQSTSFIPKYIIFIKIRRIVKKWSLRSKAIFVCCTYMIITSMVIFLGLNTFRKTQTENMSWIFYQDFELPITVMGVSGQKWPVFQQYHKSVAWFAKALLKALEITVVNSSE